MTEHALNACVKMPKALSSRTIRREGHNRYHDEQLEHGRALQIIPLSPCFST